MVAETPGTQAANRVGSIDAYRGFVMFLMMAEVLTLRSVAKALPENGFWHVLLDFLPQVPVEGDKLPHPTRFIEMTGIDRGRVGLLTRWIRPRHPLAARIPPTNDDTITPD